MNILILTCNTGAGHNAAASAIREEFERHGDRCTCTDALRLESTEFTKLVSSVHSLTYRYTPKLYAKGYRQEERSAVQWIGRLLTPAAKKLYQMLCKNDYDAVICVHVFAALIVTQMRTLYGEHTPAFFAATDYTCSPFVAQCDMDGFFIPHPLLTDEFHAAGIPKEKLIVTGIPIHQKFEDRRPQQSARAALDLPEKGTIILLASGSIGCGPLKQLYTRLACELPGGQHCCGDLRQQPQAEKEAGSNFRPNTQPHHRLYRSDQSLHGRSRLFCHESGRHQHHRSAGQGNADAPAERCGWLRDAQLPFYDGARIPSRRGDCRRSGGAASKCPAVLLS